MQKSKRSNRFSQKNLLFLSDDGHGEESSLNNALFWIGIGITLYGAAYFLVHDIFIHQRFKIFRNTDSFYLRAIRKAHKVHHKHLDKYDGECFGMLWVPMKYFIEAIETKHK